jgi:molybdopterin molybdotransferase
LISYAQALDLISREEFARPGTESLPLESAIGRILAGPIIADRDYPPFNRSQMDGYALASQDFTPGKYFRIERTVYAGREPGTLHAVPGGCVRIMTGAALPAGCDAVVRVEDSTADGEIVTFNLNSVMAGQFVSARGEDLRKGDLALAVGTAITIPNIMTLASLGIAQPEVFKPLSIALVTTGDEVISPTEQPLPWQIRNASASVLSAFLETLPVRIVKNQHVRDDRQALEAVLQNALAADLVLVTGGVSAGDADYVPDTLVSLGVEKIFHRVAIKPGKPLFFGRKNETAVFGLPGNPVSTLVCLAVFVRQHIQQRLGQRTAGTFLSLAQARTKKHDLTEFIPVALTSVNNATTLLPVSLFSSGDILACARAHGLAVQAAERKNLAAGEILEFIPFTAGYPEYGSG